MFDPQPGHQAPAASAPLHRFTRAHGLVTAPDTAELHNGAAWSRDGRSLMLSHSNAGIIYRHPYDPNVGKIGPAQPFTRVAAAEGLPDGAAIDEEGCYWCAIHGGGILHRYDPEGRLVGTMELPVSQPTMCAFVGEALDEMVVTSATGQAYARAADARTAGGGRTAAAAGCLRHPASLHGPVVLLQS